MQNNEHVEILNLENPQHLAIAYDFANKNKKWFLDDSVKTIEELIQNLNYYLKNGDYGYIYFVDNKPFSMIHIDFDYYKNAMLHISTMGNENFFKAQRILKFLLAHIFYNLGARKIKAELYVYDRASEISLRAIGFRKEGILKDEITIKGRPVNILLLAMTKRNFINNKPLTRKKLLEVIRMTNNVQKQTT